MPGLLGRAQPSPQLTTPACSQVPLTLQTKGPPESPWEGDRSVAVLEASTCGALGRTQAHLARILLRVPGTHHVITNNPDIVLRVQASVIF